LQSNLETTRSSAPGDSGTLAKDVKHLHAALANVADAVITADLSDRITYMNRAAEQLTYWQSRDAVGHSLSRVLSIVDSDSGRTIESALAAAKSPADGKANLQRAVLLGGAERPIIVEYGVSAIYDEKRDFCGTVTVFRDITGRRASELALKASEQTLLANAAALFEEKERAQVTLNSIGDAVVSTDFRGRVTFLNTIAEKMTGWTHTEASGRPLDEVFFLVDSKTREHIASPAMRAIIEDRTVTLGISGAVIAKDGLETAVEDSASPIHDERGGVVGAVVVAHDVTVAREQSEKLARLALFDNLTGLPNRTLLDDRLHQSLERAQRSKTCVALLFIDLDKFKPVNDVQGHAIGDQLLQAVASRLLTCVRHSDTVCRYGGDEFIIMLPDIPHAEDAAVCADKVLAAMNAPFTIGTHTLRISASIGVASSPRDTTSPAMLIRYADAAMYQAKADGRNRHRFFEKQQIADRMLA
jgi:diguanylate cyclase (GGDEF)-like protein/PAS domain S-box-containing protein